MSKKNEFPIYNEAASFLYDVLTTRHLFKEAICNKSEIKVFSFAPLLGFIYGEHAVLSGHKALLFKPNEYVCVALAVERSVPNIRIRLRAYSKNEALNWFLNEKCEDFIPITEHEEADLVKFKIIEDIISEHLKKNNAKIKNHNEISGIAKIFHISYFRPGSGINWSGSSALAISQAIHKFYFKDRDDDDIRKLAFSIELTYQEGKASGYGFANFAESKFIGYSLTPYGLDKIKKLKSRKIEEIIKKALNGDYNAQKEYIDYITEGKNVIFAKEYDFQLDSSLTSKLDRSISKLFQNNCSIIIADTGIPKSTGKILDKVKTDIPTDKWHNSLGEVWETRQDDELKDFGEFKDFIDKVVERLKKYKDPKTKQLIKTNLWIDSYEKLKQEFEKNNIQTVCKFTGSGGGGSLLIIVDKKNKKKVLIILKQLLKKKDKDKAQCKLFSDGSMTDYKAEAFPINIDINKNGKTTTVWWILSLLISSICLIVLYLKISKLYNEFSKNKPLTQTTFIIFSSIIVLTLFMIPFLYRLYNASCKVIPVHMRNVFQKVILHKWKICKGVGKLVELSVGRGGVQMLIWIVTLFWSNIVFIFLLLITMLFL